MMSILRLAVTMSFIACIPVFAGAQIGADPVKMESAKTNKPYKILTNGRQLTVKSNKTIRSVMVWTSGGHRVVEQKDINTTSYSFSISVNAKVFFVMLKLDDGKVYTEKIGI